MARTLRGSCVCGERVFPTYKKLFGVFGKTFNLFYIMVRLLRESRGGGGFYEIDSRVRAVSGVCVCGACLVCDA